MAIDSRDKRAAGVNIMSPWRAILPAADGSVGGLSDRQLVTFGYPILAASGVFIETHRYLYINGGQITESNMRYLALVDGVPEPDTVSGYVVLYVDASSGDLKAKFGDGFVATIAADS